MLLPSHNHFLNKLWNIIEKIHHLCDVRTIPFLKMQRKFFSSNIINLVYIGLTVLLSFSVAAQYSFRIFATTVVTFRLMKEHHAWSLWYVISISFNYKDFITCYSLSLSLSIYLSLSLYIYIYIYNTQVILLYYAFKMLSNLIITELEDSRLDEDRLIVETPRCIEDFILD
jgi:hypothetical protein